MRRGFWILIGAGLGAWLVLKAQRAAASWTPVGVVGVGQAHLRHLANDVAAALVEGRRTKRDTERQLRQTAQVRPAIPADSRPSRAANPTERHPARR